MFQIFSVIFYCHSMNIIHRDLKPENILIERKEKNGYFRIKIIDFGTAKIFETGKIEKKVIGSSYYIAPEVLAKNYSEKCDLWSCGVIMYILLTSRPPFAGDTDQEIVQKIKQGHYDMTQSPWNKISAEAKNLVKSLLQRDPTKRISAEEALNHPFFKMLKTKEKLNELKNNKMDYINNLKNYRSGKVLQTAALAFIIHNCNQHEEIQEATKLFNKFDFSQDGQINKQELLKGFRQVFGINDESLEEDIDKIFKNIDSDNNGVIEFEEFLRAAVDKEKLLTDDILKFAFRYFDKDGSGEITPTEMASVFFPGQDDNPEIQKQVQFIVNQLDENGDGRISYNEFSNMMKNILKET
jgi:calcium-dependent protein kinase